MKRSVMRDAANNRGWLDFSRHRSRDGEMLAAADRPGMAVLEPSAGMGHIADRIREKGVEPVVAELGRKTRTAGGPRTGRRKGFLKDVRGEAMTVSP